MKLTPLPLVVFILTCSQLSASTERVDGWYEVDQITAATPAAAALATGRAGRAFQYDTVDKKVGDFSIVYRQRLSPRSTKIGFTPYPSPVWDLGAEIVIHLWLKIEGNTWDTDVRFRLTVRDRQNQAAFVNLDKEAFRRQEWIKLEIPLRGMSGIEDVNLKEVSELYLDTRLSPEAVVRFDDVHFRLRGRESGGFGVTDKSIRQRMVEAQVSRNLRAAQAYEALAGEEKPPVLANYFARLWQGADLLAVNARLTEMLTTNRPTLDEQYGFADPWHLFATPWLIRTFKTFGPGDGPTNGRLTKETADALLAILRERTEEKNDIHWARARSPWWMDGSENHDLNMAVCNYLSSIIFMKHPDFAERVYPDKGTGGGSGYWFHVRQGDIRFHGPYGEAHLADGQTYVARDHYEAWGDALKEILRERARKGFFLEQASPGYMKFTLGFITDVHDFTDDPEMKALTRSFLDLVWTTWAVESLHGLRGGAKTRDHLTLNVRTDSMYVMARFLFGGTLEGGQSMYQFATTTYEFPELVWRLALDRESLGEFASVARAIGEEPGVLPRPPGLERTLNLDAEHRMFRYAWVTPEYILGAQADHPLAIHSHLSPTSRTFGLNFSTHPDARIFPYGVKLKEDGDWALVPRAGIMARTVQHENVLISQQSRGFLTMNPEWFPQRSLRAERLGIYVSPLIDKIVERDGWIFIEEGNALAAIRIVAGEYTADDSAESSAAFVTYQAQESLNEPLRTDTYEWNKDRTLIIARDDFSPIIWDCSSRRHFPTLDAFMEAVLGNRLELLKTVVPGWYRLVYQGTGGQPTVLNLNMANGEIPTINGTAQDFTPDQVFDSPFIQSMYNSGVVQLKHGALEQVLDFRKPE